jgi:hypothetical protein
VFELVAILVFFALPFGLGWVTRSYWSALLPATSLLVAIANYAANPPEGNDEIDVLPGVWIVLSAIALVVTLGAAALARRSAAGDGRL